MIQSPRLSRRGCRHHNRIERRCERFDKALTRAFRWRKMLDTGVHGTLDDLARAKGVAPSYVSRVLRLTLLAPEIVERSWTGGRGRSCSWMTC